MARCFRLGIDSKKRVDLLEAQDDGQLHGPFGQREILVTPVPPERDAVQEAQRAYGQLDTGWRELAFVGQVDNPGTDLFGTEHLG
jgi:hypothetical protein